MAKVSQPFSVLGAEGTVIIGGYVQEIEHDSKLRGTRKYRTYSNILANTSIVSAGVRLFLNLCTKAAWRVDPADDSEEAQKIAYIVKNVMEDMETPFHRVVRRAAMFRFYGFSIQEWTAKRREDGVIGYRDCDPRAQRTIEKWQQDENGRIVAAIQTDPVTGQDIVLPRGKLIYLVDDSLNDSPEGLGVFRHLVKDAEKLERLELLEGWGYETDLRGVLKIRAPLSELIEMTPEEREAQIGHLKTLMRNHIKNPSLGIMIDSKPYYSSGDNPAPSGPQKYDVELLDGGDMPHAEVAEAIERKNREIARVMGVEHLLLGGDSRGSNALSEDKTDSLALVIDATMNEVRTSFQKDFIGPLFDLNGWDRKLMPKFKVEQVSQQDILKITGAMKDLAAAGAPLSIQDPVVNAVRIQLGLPEVPEELAEAELRASEAAIQAAEAAVQEAKRQGDEEME
jgi:hypothetical protein